MIFFAKNGFVFVAKKIMFLPPKIGRCCHANWSRLLTPWLTSRFAETVFPFKVVSCKIFSHFGFRIQQLGPILFKEDPPTQINPFKSPLWHQKMFLPPKIGRCCHANWSRLLTPCQTQGSLKPYFHSKLYHVIYLAALALGSSNSDQSFFK